MTLGGSPAREERQDGRHEFLQGGIVAMAGGTAATTICLQDAPPPPPCPCRPAMCRSIGVWPWPGASIERAENWTHELLSTITDAGSRGSSAGGYDAGTLGPGGGATAFGSQSPVKGLPSSR